jgi:alpha-glucosidase
MELLDVPLTPSTVVLTRPGKVVAFEPAGRTVNVRFEHGRLQLVSVAEGIVRVRFTPAAAFAPRRSWAGTRPDDTFAAPDWEVVADGEGWRLTLPDLALTLVDGKVTFWREGVAFAADRELPGWREAVLTETRMRVQEGDVIPPGRARLELRLAKALRPGEQLYGFGQRTGKLERRGRKFSHWTIDPDFGHGRHQDNLYQAQPVFLALKDGVAWGLLLNCTYYSQIDAGATRDDVLELIAHGGELDYYLFAGPTPRAVVEQLTRLTGRPLLPPLWALGYHQSRWSYASEAEVLAIAEGFTRRGIPLDVIHLDIDYMRGYRDFTWDPDRFPDPKGLIARLGDQGVRVVTIIDPGVKAELGQGYRAADDGVAQGVFLTNPDGSLLEAYCWPDAAFFPDFTRAEVRRWWGEQHRESHLKTGVAGIWNDMNEPATFDRPFSSGLSKQRPLPLATPHGGAEERTDHAEVHNLYGHLMCRATFEGLKAGRPHKRPWVLTRSAFVGTQAYAAAWMGDNSSWWEHLELSLHQLPSMGLSGQPFVGVDIGGFFEAPSPELYARWIELGAFYPFMRTHTCAGTPPQEPWSLGPEVEEVARQAIRLRYRLLPYLYTLAHEAHRDGTPWLRPLLYDFPSDPEAVASDDQLMVGPHLLLAPVYQPGRTYRHVYLPQGGWYDFWSGTRWTAGHHTVPAALGRPPLFVRAGAALPLGNVRASTAVPLGELTWRLYPGAGEWTLCEDAGDGWGEVATTTVRLVPAKDTLTVQIGARQGGYTPAPRQLLVEAVQPHPPSEVALDGTPVAWRWDEALRAAVVAWPDDGAEHTLVITVGSTDGR